MRLGTRGGEVGIRVVALHEMVYAVAPRLGTRRTPDGRSDAVVVYAVVGVVPLHEGRPERARVGLRLARVRRPEHRRGGGQERRRLGRGAGRVAAHGYGHRRRRRLAVVGVLELDHGLLLLLLLLRQGAERRRDPAPEAAAAAAGPAHGVPGGLDREVLQAGDRPAHHRRERAVAHGRRQGLLVRRRRRVVHRVESHRRVVHELLLLLLVMLSVRGEELRDRLVLVLVLVLVHRRLGPVRRGRLLHRVELPVAREHHGDLGAGPSGLDVGVVQGEDGVDELVLVGGARALEEVEPEAHDVVDLGAEGRRRVRRHVLPDCVQVGMKISCELEQARETFFYTRRCQG